jgi:PAT family beta-lactamase induction signal transducer AmpG
MLSLGFSAGLPLLLVFGTLSFWLREAGIDRTTIGFLSWVGWAQAVKPRTRLSARAADTADARRAA